jgi:hypothetical protein
VGNVIAVKKTELHLKDKEKDATDHEDLLKVL